MKKFIGSESRYLAGIAFLFAILSISNSCSKDTIYDTPGSVGAPKGTGPGTNEVWIKEGEFTPASITINAGTTIKWSNKDYGGYNITSTTGVFDSGYFGNGAIFTFKFDAPGTYSYYNKYYSKLHQGMTGTVVVN